jgi:hypothetical protein
MKYLVIIYMLALFSRVGESSDIERNGTTLKSPTLNILKLESSETLTDFEGKPLPYIKQFNGKPLMLIKLPSINKLNETKVYRLVQIDHDSFLIVNE